MTTTRRDFLKTAGLASAGFALGGIKMDAASYGRIVGANEKVNLACVGIGFRGNEIIKEFAKTNLANVVALCDIDMGAKHTQEVISMFPNAPQFKDFRQMFDKMGNQFDAVCAGIPDFAHYPVTIHTIKAGKGIYIEKPMCRTFHEGELMIKAAKKYPKVVTQMGNQGHSEGNYFQFKAWKEAGIIKDVTAVTAHMNSARRWHTWDPKITKYPLPDPMPEGIDWDTWNMANWYHEYNDNYHRGQWRCWYDLGMGALGDWGAHIIDTIHEFLELGLPYEVNPLYLKDRNDYFFPMSSTIQFRFKARKKMPAVDITWYDGTDNIPAVPEGYGKVAVDPNIPAVGGGKLQPQKLNPGKEIYSKTLTFKGGSHGSTLEIIPDEKAKEMASKLPDVPKSPSNHYANFLLSVAGKEKTRSPFEIAGPLSQVFCLGVMAQRFGTKIEFDTVAKKVTNNPFADAFLYGAPPRSGWEEYYVI
ncbi:MAG: Gfo/Idh/MocA family oxidoreductase [Tannerella sp.]|nr:Gfo/Idh/MocA family oxidoreductase [Tannerella sp.]